MARRVCLSVIWRANVARAPGIGHVWGKPDPGMKSCAKPSSSRPPARRSAKPIAALSTTPPARRSAATPSLNAVSRAKIDGAEVDDVVMGAALQQGSTGGNVARQCALRAGIADQRRRHVARPAMRLRPDGDRHRRQADHRRRHERHGRRRPRIDQPRAERPHEPLPRRRSLAAGASRRHLHVDAGDGRDRRRALQNQPRGARRLFPAIAAARTAAGAGRRAVRSGDRAAVGEHESAGQGDRRRQRQGDHAQTGRGQPRRHDARRACQG